MFIAFEGIDGCGKSTQLKLLDDYMRGLNITVETCKDPGSTPTGNKIRDILLDRASAMCVETEALLFAAARTELVQSVIQPALELRRAVLCDRFYLSSLAYQCGGMKLSEKWLSDINDVAVSSCMPDLTLMIDVPVTVALQRVSDHKDRIEQRGFSFFENVRKYFLSAQPGLYLEIINGMGTIQEVHDRVIKAVQKRFPELEI